VGHADFSARKTERKCAAMRGSRETLRRDGELRDRLSLSLDIPSYDRFAIPIALSRNQEEESNSEERKVRSVSLGVL